MPRTRRNTAPSRARAGTSLATSISRCLGSGASSSSMRPQTKSNSFLEISPASTPTTMLTGRNRNFTAPPPSIAELAGVPRLHERLLVRGVAGVDLSPALAFGVDLGPQQDRDVRDPQPHEEDDDAGQ